VSDCVLNKAECHEPRNTSGLNKYYIFIVMYQIINGCLKKETSLKRIELTAI